MFFKGSGHYRVVSPAFPLRGSTEARVVIKDAHTGRITTVLAKNLRPVPYLEGISSPPVCKTLMVREIGQLRAVYECQIQEKKIQYGEEIWLIESSDIPLMGQWVEPANVTDRTKKRYVAILEQSKYKHRCNRS